MVYGFQPETGARLLGIPPEDWQEPQHEFQVADTATVTDRLLADVSNWDYPTFDAACSKGRGITQAIVGCWDASLARDMVQAYRAQGIRVPALYQWFAFDRGIGPQTAMERCIKLAADLKVPMAFADVESDSTTNAPSGATQRISQLRSVLDMIDDAKLRPGIYSAPWFWGPYMANTPQFAERGDITWWLANYGANDGTLAPIRLTTFGQVVKVGIHQYWSLGNYCGRRERDINYVWSDAFEEEDEVTKEEQDALSARLDTIEANNKLLNDAIVKRYNIMRVASGTDEQGYADMLKGYDALQKEGLVP